MVGKKSIALFVLFFLGMEAAAAAAIDARLDSIAKRLTTLADDEAAFWLRYGPDPSGGIYGLIKENGTHSSTEQKGLVQQSRFLWTFSTWYERGHKTAEIKALCDNLYDFITKNMSLGSSGDFASAVSADGKTKTDPGRSCYSEAFAIYGLSQYGRVFNKQAAIDRAMACFQAMLARAWDATYLGVDLTKDDSRSHMSRTAKETNTHIHVMEAFTALYLATKNEAVKTKLRDMVDLLCKKIIQPSGYCHIRFNRDWSTYGTSLVSYGHDIETSWLMLESAEALGLMHDSLILKQSAAIAGTSSREGLEASTGCFFLEGELHGDVTDFSRIWWPQNEGLAGHWWRYKLTKDTTWLKRLEAGITWIEKKQTSKSCKVCYWAVDANGNATGTTGTTIGSFWKANYHSMRSYLFVRDWVLEEIALGAVRPDGGAGVNASTGAWRIHVAPDRRHARLDAPFAENGAVSIRLFTPAGRCLLDWRGHVADNTSFVLFPFPSMALARQHLFVEASSRNGTRVMKMPLCK